MNWFFGAFHEKSSDADYPIESMLTEYFGELRNYKKHVVAGDDFFFAEFTDDDQVSCFQNDEVITFGTFRLKYLPDADCSQPEYVSSLYKEHGEKFTDHLYGEFAFALCDRRKRQMILVRDHFGLEQIFWHAGDDKDLHVANHLWLLKDYYSKTEISESFLEQFIKNNGLCCFRETPYKGVQRLNAAEFLVADLQKNTVEPKTYWELTAVGKAKNVTYEEAAARLKELVTGSVREHAASKKKCGIMLSGGLDSTILYSAMDRKKTIAFSAVFDELESCDEKAYLNHTKEYFEDADVKYVKADKAGFFEGYPDSFFYTSEPDVNCMNRRFSEIMFEQAQENDVKYVVDGFLADHVFSGNVIYVLDEMKLSRLPQNYQRIREYAELRNVSVWEVIIHELLRAKKDPLFIPQIDESITKSNAEKLRRANAYGGKELVVQITSAIARNYGDREIAPRYSVEMLHPYVDRKIVEFLYGLPGEYLMKKGVPKALLKEAFHDAIPSEIRDRLCKTQHVELSHQGIHDNWGNVWPTLSKGRITQIKTLNLSMEEWIRILNEFRAGKTFNDVTLICIALELWLNSIEVKYGKLSIN